MLRRHYRPERRNCTHRRECDGDSIGRRLRHALLGNCVHLDMGREVLVEVRRKRLVVEMVLWWMKEWKRWLNVG